MDWQISFLEEEQIVVLETAGRLDPTQSLAMAREGLAAGQQRGWRRGLIDHSRITFMEESTLAMYQRPGELHRLGMLPYFRVAEVVPAALAGAFEFLETVSANRGFQIRVFADRAAALRWLLAD